MFGRSKYKGTVDIIEDDDDDGVIGSPTPRLVRDGEKTNEEMRDAIREEARRGKQELDRALRDATEARDTGLETAEKLHNQTEQLEKNSEDLAAIHDKMDQAEGLVHKLTTPFHKRIFTRKPKTGKGLKDAKPDKKDRKEREKLREQGVEALNISGGEEGDYSMSPEGEIEVKNAEKEKRKHLFSGRKETGSFAPNPEPLRDDYAEFDSDTRQVLHDQDDTLDEISKIVAETQQIANAMNNEISYQEGRIEQVVDEVEATKGRTKKLVSKMTRK